MKNFVSLLPATRPLPSEVCQLLLPPVRMRPADCHLLLPPVLPKPFPHVLRRYTAKNIPKRLTNHQNKAAINKIRQE